jgi:hypothetical protein
MSNITKEVFNHKVNLTFLPTEPLIGLNIHNCEVLCADEEFRPLFGIEIGLLFFTLSYTNISWK